MKIFKNIIIGLICTFIALFLVFACEDQEYDIEYQNGYPNRLTGNWIAYDFQGQDLSSSAISDEYNLVMALDPNNPDSLIIDNIYDSGIRVKTYFNDTVFYVTKGRQLEVINYGQYGIYRVSVDGILNYDEDIGDYLLINVGLYDKYSELADTIFVLAFRKTGFEDIDYQSLLGNK